MLKGIALFFLSTISPSETEDDKPFYFRSYENPSPIIDKYKIGGNFGLRKVQFALSLDFSDERWHVKIEEGGKPVRKLSLDSAYKSIPFNRIIVTTDGKDSNLIVIIPFGNPHSECFSNGDDVYSSLVIEGSGQVGLEHFPQCKFEMTDLPLKKVNGAVEVGPPPK